MAILWQIFNINGALTAIQRQITLNWQKTLNCHSSRWTNIGKNKKLKCSVQVFTYKVTSHSFKVCLILLFPTRQLFSSSMRDWVCAFNGLLSHSDLHSCKPNRNHLLGLFLATQGKFTLHFVLVFTHLLSVYLIEKVFWLDKQKENFKTIQVVAFYNKIKVKQSTVLGFFLVKVYKSTKWKVNYVLQIFSCNLPMRWSGHLFRS